MAGEIIKTELTSFIKQESNPYTGWPEDDNNVGFDDHNQNNEYIISENIIKQEPDGFDNLDDGPKVQSFHEDPDRIKCLLCDKYFLSTKELSLHALEHTKCEAKEDLPKERKSSKAPKPVVTEYSMQELLQNYVNIAVELDGETSYTCKLCTDKVFTQLASIRNHMKIHENRSHKERSCHICNKTFALRESLLEHLKGHNHKPKYKCNICDAYFTDPSSLTAHKGIHTVDKPYGCSICSKAFKEVSQLADHQKIHSASSLQSGKKLTSDEDHRDFMYTDARATNDEKPFKCQLCTYSTTQSGYLRRHMKTHTGERPHKCSYCDKAFVERKRLVSHTRSHTGERPFKCTYCDATYARNDNLKYHLRTHTGERPFECIECGKRFIQRAALNGHQKIHSNEKPFSCLHCQMNFRSSGTLATHLLTHTNERPFKCNFCEKGFNQKALLKRHVAREHSDEADNFE